jgi:hypothetical protein
MRLRDLQGRWKIGQKSCIQQAAGLVGRGFSGPALSLDLEECDEQG